MKMNMLRGGLLAAVSVFALGYGLTLITTQQAAAQSAQPGVLTSKGVWNANTTYAIDAVVTLRGSTWRSKVNNNKNHVPGSTNPNNAAFWEVLAVGFNPRGNWSSAVTYQPNELVVSGGQTWRAKVTVAASATVPAAGANWELWVTKGATGATGPTGPAGPNTGIGPGNQGSPSISFNGDSNTGIFSPGTDQIALVEGGQLFLHSKGSLNTALGLSALSQNSTGQENTVLGYQAMQSSVSGSSNVALGPQAMGLADGASYNVAIGPAALLNNTANDNIAVGVQALVGNTSGPRNVAVGNSTLFANVSGANNTAVGHQALHDSTTADNTAVGYNALAAQTNGQDNTAVGANALAANTTGDSNTAVGRGALAISMFGDNNSALGRSALVGNQTGQSNTAIGKDALSGNANGNLNTGIGDSALYTNTAGTNNIAVGAGAGINPTAPSDSIFIGNFGQPGDTKIIRIGDTHQERTFIGGIVGVDANSFTNSLPVAIDLDTGQLGVQMASSRTAKADIETLADVSAALGKLRPVTFHYKQALKDGSKPLQYGLIAEEVAEVIPYLAAYNPDGAIRTVHYDRLPTFLLAGWQAQQKTIAAQAEEIARLKERVAATEALEARLARLEASLPRTTKAALQ